jgi:hypothetical protein
LATSTLTFGWREELREGNGDAREGGTAIVWLERQRRANTLTPFVGSFNP